MASYFIRRGSICKGPFSDQKIRSLLKEKKLRPTDEVAQTKDGPWSTVGLLFGNVTEARGAKPLNYDETDFQNSEEAPTQSVFNTRGSVEDHRNTDVMNVEPYAINISPQSSSEIPDTIPCRRCGRLVGIEVDQCMECGTHNKWVHPKVERLINNVESIEWGEYIELNWQWTRTSILIYGNRETKYGKTMNIAGKLVLIALIMFLFNPMIAITIIVAAFFGMAISAITMKSVVEILEMRVDFSTVPPVWNCNDGEFFKPVVCWIWVHRKERKKSSIEATKGQIGRDYFCTAP